MKPKLIIVQGAPASGKTTVSRALVERLPGTILVSKDNIKEFLFDTQPSGDRNWSRTLGRASIAAMYAMAEVFLASGRTVLLESAFDAEFAASDIQALKADSIEVYCYASPAVLEQRFAQRAETSRHPGHLDNEATYDGTAALAQYAPLGIGMSLALDTEAGIADEQYDTLVQQITDFLEDD